MLGHMQQNLTQEVQGELFGMIQSDANKWLQLLRPVLYQALQKLDTIPPRLAMLMTEQDEASDDAVPFFIMMVRKAPSNAQ